MRIFTRRPEPDVASFVQGIQNHTPFSRVHFVELFLDPEVVRYILEKYLDGHWVEPYPDDIESQIAYWKKNIRVWHQLGYDYVRMVPMGADGLHFPTKRRVAKDTAVLHRGERSWANQDTGPISSWEDCIVRSSLLGLDRMESSPG